MDKDLKAINAAIQKQSSSVSQLTSSVNKLVTSLKPGVSKASPPKQTPRRQRRSARNPARQNVAGSARTEINRQIFPASISTDTGMKRLSRLPRGELTTAGLSFLQCAFAPPDFAVTDVKGVPDDFQGQSLIKKHRMVRPYTLTAGNDIYFLLAPTPGYAYWLTTTSADTPLTAAAIWIGIPYDDSNILFGTSPATTNDLVSKFRYVSNHIEVIPTVNQMQWTGAIQAWKMPVQFELRQGGSGTDFFTIAGLAGANALSPNQYTAPFNLGFYGSCYNANCDFPFTPVLNGVINVPTVPGADDFGQLSTLTNFPGFDNSFESLVVKMSGVGSNTDDSLIIKTWACVEYQVNSGTILYEYTQLSPEDKYAVEVYRKIILDLPVGVPYSQNESFWERIKGIIRSITGATSFIPGPIGMISAGVRALTN